jgi:nucleoporin POM34
MSCRPVIHKIASPIAQHGEYPTLLLRLACFFNILMALYPLVRRKDDFSDIPLTPSQRALLGLDPNTTPPLTPGGTYITPPRYALSSPRTGTPVSHGSSYTNSPLSGNGSPSFYQRQGGSPFSPSSPSPLLQKAIGLNGRDATRRHSYGSPSPLGGSKGGSLISYPATPSPTAGKGASVGLNNRWLYERGRGSPGGKSIYS